MFAGRLVSYWFLECEGAACYVLDASHPHELYSVEEDGCGLGVGVVCVSLDIWSDCVVGWMALTFN